MPHFRLCVRVSPLLSVTALFVGAISHAETACPAISVTPNSNYSYLVASAPPTVAGTWRWVVNGAAQDPVAGAQTLLLHADASAVSDERKTPLQLTGAGYKPGRWNSAFSLEPQGQLTYATADTLDLNEGTIEMWIALRAAGGDPQYTANQTLFAYQSPNGDSLQIVQDGPQGVIYAAATTNGKWQSAWSNSILVRKWAAGEWHHLAYSWSSSANRTKFYLDGVLAADTHADGFLAPSADGDRFAIGGTLNGEAAAYLVDEVRITERALTSDEVKWSAQRTGPTPSDELLLSLATRSPGDRIQLQFTPKGGTACQSAVYSFPGVPILGVEPASTLLLPGATSVALTVTTRSADQCRWSLDPTAPFERMQATGIGANPKTLSALVTGLDADPAIVNKVYLRCASTPDYVQTLLYRSLPRAEAPFPRKGNLWGSWLLRQGGMEHAARIDLHLGAEYSPSEIAQIRKLNPNALILTSINTVENSGLPEDYYLHDIHGKRIETWPNTFRLNLTKTYVAEYQAMYAYQLMLDSGMMYDGCFFDNFFLDQSSLKTDIYGNAVQIDSNEDGTPDDSAALDTAWRAGVIHELELWRKLMPNGIASGHHYRPPDPDALRLFNGDSVGFLAPGVVDGRYSFDFLWGTYNEWFAHGRTPSVMMIESAPPWQIGYGYGYDPLKNMPPSTIEFARTYYPYVRFGLAMTLMQDGYFSHEIGDTYHGNDWWYDELDYNLGYPTGAARRIPNGTADSTDIVSNGGFEQGFDNTWDLWVDTGAGCAATATRDTSVAKSGAASALIGIAALGNCGDWQVEFHQYNLSLVQGQAYELSFWAKADSTRGLTLSAGKQVPDWRNYGLSYKVTVGTEWQQFVVPFTANESAADARLQFLAGTQIGKLWLDGVELRKAPPSYLRRDFDFGTVLLNTSKQRQSIQLGSGHRRLKGAQAARFEFIVDDADAAFQAAADWRPENYDSGLWKATGPYYHQWGTGSRQCDNRCGTAGWELGIQADDAYTVAAWWPAAPGASGWSKNVVFELVTGNQVVASSTVDQSTGGDQWHTLFTVPLKAAAGARVQIRNQGSGPAIADALWVRSSLRYNDGTRADSITLEPLDGIVLQHDPMPPRQQGRTVPR